MGSDGLVAGLTVDERAQLEPFLHWVACPHCEGAGANLTGTDFCPVCQRAGRVLASTANILRVALIFADMDGSKRAPLEAELAEMRSLVGESDLVPQGEHARLIAENARLRDRYDGMFKALGHFTRNYLLDERDSPEVCMDAEHHAAVLALFNQLDDARAILREPVTPADRESVT